MATKRLEMSGKIFLWLEQGMAGGILAFQDDLHVFPDGSYAPEGTYVLCDGDDLTVYEDGPHPRKILWRGIVKLRPKFPGVLHLLFPCVLPKQTGVKRRDWIRWFTEGRRAFLFRDIIVDEPAD